MELIAKLIREEEGQSMVEYGLILGLITVVCAGAYKAMGAQIDTFINKVKDDLIGALKK